LQQIRVCLARMSNLGCTHLCEPIRYVYKNESPLEFIWHRMTLW
jgi:hypothetical protein